MLSYGSKSCGLGNKETSGVLTSARTFVSLPKTRGMPLTDRYDKGMIRNELLLSVERLKQWDKVLITRALGLAEEVHQKHFRMPLNHEPFKIPFIVHPLRVALILIEELRIVHPEPVSAALLHDVVEDSEGAISTFDLEKRFGRNVALMVSCMTRPAPDAGIPRQRQLEIYLERIAQSAKYTRIIKLAERLDNLRDLNASTDAQFQQDYLKQTVEVYLPIAENTDKLLHSQLESLCRQLQLSIPLPVGASE